MHSQKAVSPLAPSSFIPPPLAHSLSSQCVTPGPHTCPLGRRPGAQAKLSERMELGAVPDRAHADSRPGPSPFTLMPRSLSLCFTGSSWLPQLPLAGPTAVPRALGVWRSRSWGSIWPHPNCTCFYHSLPLPLGAGPSLLHFQGVWGLASAQTTCWAN